MPTENTTNRRPYHDTGPIPHKFLSQEQRKIIFEISQLLVEIKKSAEDLSGKEDDRNNSNHNIWATSTPKLNNIILLDGERGAGKTSLLFTLIEALSNPNDWDKEEDNDNCNLPSRIDKAVRVLQPIDFDPLPPELPIYNWIIQAFDPMVRKFDSAETRNFFEDDGCEEESDSITTLFRDLHQAATIGWTTGLLKSKLGKDAGEYLLWQREQQMGWKRLQELWHNFIDKLLKKSENSDSIDGYPLPPNCLIVLPIDDLDMQVTRTRELLLALRVLRHNRLVYLLTGDRNNTDLALTTSFYRDFMHGTSEWNQVDRDRVFDSSERLGPALRKKSIPSSQIFTIEGMEIKDALEWIPPVHNNLHRKEHTENLKMTLNNLGIFAEGGGKLGGFLESRHADKRFGIKLTFRELQGFSDKWNSQSNSSIDGVEEFLKMVLEEPNEELLVVDVEKRIGSPYDGIIKINGHLSRSAVVSNSVDTFYEGDSTIKWFTQLDFYQSSEWRRGILRRRRYRDDEIAPVTPRHLLAYDLAYGFPDLVEIGRNIMFIGYPLGFIWTEFNRGDTIYIVNWPMVKIPYSPSEIFEKHRKWISELEEGRSSEGSITYELLKNTWCEFNELEGKEQNDFVEFLDDLTYKTNSLAVLLETNKFARTNANKDPWRRLTKPRVFESDFEEEFDYCEFVFNLRFADSRSSWD